MTSTSPVTTNPTFCAALYNTGASSVDWLGKTTKNLTASAGEFFGKVWASVSAFFSSIAATLAQWANTAKEGLLAAKDQIVALPKETKVVGGIALAVTAAFTWIACSLWNKAPAAPVPAAPAAVLVPTAQIPAAPVVLQQPPAPVVAQQPAFAPADPNP